MEQNFQTSFIPKKPIIEDRAIPQRPINLFTVLGIFLLFAVVVSSGGLYFYQATLTRSIAKMSNDLGLAKNRFEPERINQLKVLDKRLRASKEILGKHVAISPIFQALEELTLPTVRYTKFDYELVPPANKILVKLKGVAIGYKPIALQSDLFVKNKNLIDPAFANLVLDDKGNVTFDLSFTVDSTYVDYKQMLETATSQATPPLPLPVTPPESSTMQMQQTQTQ